MEDDKFVLIVGTIRNGFRFYGPFDSLIAAEDFIEFSDEFDFVEDFSIEKLNSSEIE